MHTLTCKWCGKEFQIHAKCVAATRKFCSIECAYKGRDQNFSHTLMHLWTKKYGEERAHELSLLRARKRIAALKEQKYSFKLSEETKKKISLSHMGKVMSEEFREKLSVLTRGKSNPMYGQRHTEETRRKISEANTGKTCSTELRQRLRISRIKYMREHYDPRGYISSAQRKLFNIVRAYFPDATLEYRVNTDKSVRFLDIAVPYKMLAFEMNGAYWHKNRIEEDNHRHDELIRKHWDVTYFSDLKTEKEWQNKVKEIYTKCQK